MAWIALLLVVYLLASSALMVYEEHQLIDQEARMESERRKQQGRDRTL